MSVDGIREALRRHAAELGFTRVGVTRPQASDHIDFYRSWIGDGNHGEMGYLAGDDAVRRRADLSATMDDVASVVVVAHEYFQEDSPGVPDDASSGVIARYARGRDYHRLVKKKLVALLDRLDGAIEGGVRGRAYVDTGPILEREVAQRAGLGWFGRNTMLIHPTRGSYFFLGVLLVDVELPLDEPFSEDRCGTCRSCLDHCPTGALLGRNADGAPVMDARRCISYLTIEHRGAIPVELRPLIGNRVYGCDICQEVCPFNIRFAEVATEPGYAPRGPGERPVGVEALPSAEAGDETDVGLHGPIHPGTEAPALIDLLDTALDEDAWDSLSRGSAIRRAGRAGFARNLCVALGNWGSEEAVPVLRRALDDDDPVVRAHAAWALGQIGRPAAAELLTALAAREDDPSVREEVAAASKALADGAQSPRAP